MEKPESKPRAELSDMLEEMQARDAASAVDHLGIASNRRLFEKVDHSE